jgi:hypothetical protein
MSSTKVGLKTQEISKRDFHHNHNNILSFSQPEYKTIAKRDYKPKDNDPFIPVRTETPVTSQTTFQKYYSNSNASSILSNKSSVKETKPIDLKPALQHQNFTKKIVTPKEANKDKDINLVRIENIKHNDDPASLKRKLNQMGISPIKVKYDQNPITHEYTGTGVVVVDWGKQERTQKTIDNLDKMGYKAKQMPKIIERGGNHDL